MASAKLRVAEQILSEGDLWVHLDPRVEGVIVPQAYLQQTRLVLQIGLNCPTPIRDLEMDEDGWRATLSFNRTPFWCNIPWASVFALVDHERQGQVWHTEVPDDAFKNASSGTQRTPAKVGVKRPSYLRLVK